VISETKCAALLPREGRYPICQLIYPLFSPLEHLILAKEGDADVSRFFPLRFSFGLCKLQLPPSPPGRLIGIRSRCSTDIHHQLQGSKLFRWIFLVSSRSVVPNPNSPGPRPAWNSGLIFHNRVEALHILRSFAFLLIRVSWNYKKIGR
jgi:hypothetical protein